MIGVGTSVKVVASRDTPPYFKRFVGKIGVIHTIDNDGDYPYTVYLGPKSKFRYMRFSPQELIPENKSLIYPLTIPSHLSQKDMKLLLRWDKKRAKRENRLLNTRYPLTPRDKYYLEMDAKRMDKRIEKSRLREAKIKQRWIKRGEAKDRTILAKLGL